MKHVMLALALFCACATQSGPLGSPVDLHVEAAEIVETVLVASDPASAAPEVAWREAHARFERHLEGPLRARHGDRVVAEVEYRFGAVRAHIGRPGAAEVARALGERVAALCADLPAGVAGA